MTVRQRIEESEARIGAAADPEPRSPGEWGDFLRWNAWLAERARRKICLAVEEQLREQGGEESPREASFQDMSELKRLLAERSRASNEPRDRYLEWRDDAEWAGVRNTAPVEER